MPILRDFHEYQRSIAAEMDLSQNRIRHLIGDRHWGEDGRHKEAILRRTLRAHVAESLRVGTGFVAGPHATSHQTDVLIVSRNRPVLFRDEETLIVTPDTAAGIIEVKTQLTRRQLDEALCKLAKYVKLIRSAGNCRCGAGLFIYKRGRLSHTSLLQALAAAARDDPQRVVNWVAAGPDLFTRYWEEGQVWHSYDLPELAFAYFVSNVVWHTCPAEDRGMRFPWFPLTEGKGPHRKNRIKLDQRTVKTL